MRRLSKLRHGIVNNLEDFLFGVSLLLVLLFLAVMVWDGVEKWVSSLLGIGGESNSKYDVLRAVAFGLVGVLLAWQASISYRRAKAMEDAANAQARATEEQAKANQNAEQGQRQERLKNAIEHLGHASDSVRMGGAYELFHLARDTQGRDAEELRQTVLDILCAHIRRTTGESEYRERHKPKPSEEIQSLLTLLFVREPEVFKGLHINLQGSWLDGANLREARLEKAVLTEAYLRGADLAEADLKEANMTKTHLQGADLTEARMQRACLRRTRMQGACLNEARLNEAKLYWVQMQGAKLMAARMQGASLLHTEMQGADLHEARLQLAMLTDVGLQAARLVKAQLQAATLDGVRLGGVTPEGSSLVEERIRDRIGMSSTLVGTIFQGGLTEQDVASILEAASASDRDPNVLKASLDPHIGEPASDEPESNGVFTDPYIAEEAERWIAEYEQAMSEVPEDDS